jgi:hypothetical protein
MSDGTDDAPKRRRLRVPVALAVAFVGSAGVVSVWYGGCHHADPEPVDAGRLEMPDNDGGNDAGTAEEDAPTGMDAGTTPDAPRDAAPPPDAPDH